MSAVSMHYAALRYLDQWFGTEAPIRELLGSHRQEDVFGALERGAAFFRIARNCPTEYDEGLGLRRYAPVAALIRRLPACVPSDVDDFVESFASAVGSQYSGNRVLSFASKVLWLKYRDPIVIYDGNVKKALRFRGTSYVAYRKAWDAHWQDSAGSITEACRELPSVTQWAACGRRVGRSGIANVASRRWFQRRVLDIALWTNGA